MNINRNKKWIYVRFFNINMDIVKEIVFYQGGTQDEKKKVEKICCLDFSICDAFFFRGECGFGKCV